MIFRSFRKKHNKAVDQYFELNRSGNSGKLLVLDTEATSLDNRSSELLSFGYVLIEDDSISIDNSGEIFLKHEISVIDQSAEIHQITTISSEAVDKEQFAESLLSICANHTLIAHVADFDISIINKLLNEVYGIKLRNKIEDTFKMAVFKEYGAQASHIEKNKFTLDALISKYSLPVTGRHTALGDAYMTAMLYLFLKAS